MGKEQKNVQTTGTANNTNSNNSKKEMKKGNKVMNATPAKELTPEQKEQLKKLSEEILGNLTRNYALGKALSEVKSLLEGTAEKFEPYCKEHFKLAHSQVNRLMNYAKVRDNIGMGDQDVYIPENMLRGLDKYTAEIQVKIWEEAKRMAGDQMPTTAQVQDARKKIAPKTEQKPGDKKMQFHSRALNVQVDLKNDKPVEIIRKAENVAQIKAVIKEIIQRKGLTEEEQKDICEFIKSKAESEAMELMTSRSAGSEEKDNGEEKAA